jgi:hypothetical protein
MLFIVSQTFHFRPIPFHHQCHSTITSKHLVDRTNVLFNIVADLEHFLRRLVANDARVVVRRVVAMSHCRSSQIEGFAICIYKSQETVRHGDNAQHDIAPFGVLH